MPMKVFVGRSGSSWVVFGNEMVIARRLRDHLAVKTMGCCRLLLSVVVALGGALACGDDGVDCRAQCEKVADDLVSVFLISAPCTEPAWDGADSCGACDRTLQELYSVVPDTPLCEQ